MSPSGHVVKDPIENVHIPECGAPPELEPNQPGFVSYYRDQYGEQHAFVYDEENERALWFCGDAGWDRPSVFPKERILDVDMDEHPRKVIKLSSYTPDEIETLQAEMFEIMGEEAEQYSEVIDATDDSLYADMPVNGEKHWLVACLKALQPSLKHEVTA